MVKIIIPDRDEKIVVQRNRLELNLEAGDLILLP